MITKTDSLLSILLIFMFQAIIVLVTLDQVQREKLVWLVG